MPKGYEYSYGAGNPGLGDKYGDSGIAGPFGDCPYNVDAGSGPSKKGGEPQGPFGSSQQSPGTALPIVGRDGLAANPNAGGELETPMDTSTAMPGVTGQSSGTGPKSSGGISTPWTGPFKEKAG